MIGFTVLLPAFLALVACRSVNKREILRDPNLLAIGPTVRPDQADSYRYQVALGSNCGQSCGGTIISDRLILTAAHCVYGEDPRSMTIKAGITYVDDNKSAKIGEVFDIRIHRNYFPSTLLNDIALIVLQEPLDLTHLTVAQLPQIGENFDGEEFEMSGWGNTPNLTYALFTVADQPACEHKSRLCGIPHANMRSYPGDSGGPAVIRKGKEVTLIGVVSGISGGTEYFFANVANLRQWIDDAITQAFRTSKVADHFVTSLPKHNCQ